MQLPRSSGSSSENPSQNPGHFSEAPPCDRPDVSSVLLCFNTPLSTPSTQAISGSKPTNARTAVDLPVPRSPLIITPPDARIHKIDQQCKLHLLSGDPIMMRVPRMGPPTPPSQKVAPPLPPSHSSTARGFASEAASKVLRYMGELLHCRVSRYTSPLSSSSQGSSVVHIYCRALSSGAPNSTFPYHANQQSMELFTHTGADPLWLTLGAFCVFAVFLLGET